MSMGSRLKHSCTLLCPGSGNGCAVGTRLNIKVNRDALAFHQFVSQSSAARSALRQQHALPPAAASVDSVARHAGPATTRIRRLPSQGDSLLVHLTLTRTR